MVENRNIAVTRGVDVKVGSSKRDVIRDIQVKEGFHRVSEPRKIVKTTVCGNLTASAKEIDVFGAAQNR